ncbi:MAG TPA: hypothetical protein DCR90_02315 [Fusobacteriaceae bacterium]|jgi:hypothetical protein|nr:hypothetical protein [Fusobacteriaceae bacterium]
MTKKQVILCRFILIFISIFTFYFLNQNFFKNKKQKISQVIKKIKNNEDKKIEREIELNIRPDDFYKIKDKK